jgi:hypothetical protein
MSSLPGTSLPISHADSPAVRDLAQQYLLDQLAVAAEAYRAAKRELDRLGIWSDGRKGGYHDEINLACGHTARLLSAMARMQTAQASSAAALARLEARTEHRVVVAREGDPGVKS